MRNAPTVNQPPPPHFGYAPLSPNGYPLHQQDQYGYSYPTPNHQLQQQVLKLTITQQQVELHLCHQQLDT